MQNQARIKDIYYAILSLWRNRLARSAVNREDGGSSPPRDGMMQIATSARDRCPRLLAIASTHTWDSGMPPSCGQREHSLTEIFKGFGSCQCDL